LSSTGISTISPWTLGRLGGDLERHVGAQGGAADDGTLGPEMVEQSDDLVCERAHGVHQRVRGPVGATVPEQVERHDVHPVDGQGARQRLVHPAWHELTVEQHHPARTRAVLGVLQALVARPAVEEELPHPLGDQHGIGI
jgi:hypothetical protein